MSNLGETILVVEDDPSIKAELETLKKNLD